MNSFIRTAGLGLLVTTLGLGLAANVSAVAPPAPSDKVTVEKVSFQNRYLIKVVGNLYVPKEIDRTKKYAAIVVGHPFLGVKEQTSGLHAQELAELGFVTLAFDASHYGESGGEPRGMEDPSTRVEDFSAAVDFLSNHPLVDPQRIGLLGICGGGGYSVAATAIDHRIKALATVSMYDMGRARRSAIGDVVPYDLRMKTLDEVGEQRTKEFRGEPRRNYNSRTDLNPNPAANADLLISKELGEYYGTPRGAYPSQTPMSFVSLAPMMNFFPFAQIETISPRPILFIVGSRAESAYFSYDAYNKATQPKELFLIQGASHVDLYDKPEFHKISIPKLASFFQQYLK